MSTQHNAQNTTPTYPGHVPPKRRRRWIAPTAIGAAALFVGVGIGNAGSGSEVQASQSTLTPTVTVTAEPETVTETVEVEVETTPQSCITALDLSGEALILAGDVIALQSEALGIAAALLEDPFNGDQSSIDRVVEITAEIEGKTAEIEGKTPNAGAASTECRAAS